MSATPGRSWRALVLALCCGLPAACDDASVESTARAAAPCVRLALELAQTARPAEPFHGSLDDLQCTRGEARRQAGGEAPRLDVSDDEAVRLTLPGRTDLLPYTELVVSLRSASDVSLFVSHEGSPGAGRQRWPVQTVPASSGSEVATLRIPIPFGARTEVEGLSLFLKGEGGVDVRLFALHLTAGERLAPALAPFEAAHRRVQVLEPQRRYEARATALPADAHVGFTFALWPGSASGDAALVVRARLAEEGEGSEREVLRLSAAEARSGWRAVSAPLESALGPDVDRPVVVTIELESDEPLLASVGELALFTPAADAPTVLLVTSDTHRGDHVEFAGGGTGVRTPALLELARRGVVFEDALASSNVTLPSHTALMTGLTPRDTGVVDNASSVADEARTLAERFAQAGWLTWGVTSASLLEHPISGLGQGFDRYAGPGPSARDSRRRAHATIDQLERWWPDAAGRPLFVWVHVFDVHAPYAAPDEFLDAYWGDGRDPFDPTLAAEDAHAPPWAAEVRDPDYLRARYKAGVTWVDDELERLLAQPRVQSGVVAFTSDHGENLGGHDLWWVHRDVYRATLHVPLVVAWPGAPAGRRVTDPVRQVDLGRTLLELAGVAPDGFPGASLLEVLEGPRAARPRFAVAAREQSLSITYDGWQLVQPLEAASDRARRPRPGAAELFDLSRDPAGEVDVAEREPERAAELAGWLERWWSERSATLLGGRRDDPATQRMLAELGYLDDAAEER